MTEMENKIADEEQKIVDEEAEKSNNVDVNK
jgi:hypothetical protein